MLVLCNCPSASKLSKAGFDSFRSTQGALHQPSPLAGLNLISIIRFCRALDVHGKMWGSSNLSGQWELQHVVALDSSCRPKINTKKKAPPSSNDKTPPSPQHQAPLPKVPKKRPPQTKKALLLNHPSSPHPPAPQELWLTLSYLPGPASRRSLAGTGLEPEKKNGTRPTPGLAMEPLTLKKWACFFVLFFFLYFFSPPRPKALGVFLLVPFYTNQNHPKQPDMASVFRLAPF